MSSEIAAESSRPSWLPSVVRRRPALAACVVLFAFALALYTSTMAPGLTWANVGGDGGDFLAAAHVWGIPHPTGYPTYLVLLRSFDALIWFGNDASAGNLFSAVSGALSIPLFFMATRKLLLRLPVSETKGRTLPFVCAFVIALGFATSNLLWSQSTITEVYALNAMFATLFLWLGLITRAKIERGEATRNVRTAMALLLGIAFGNHVTISFIAVPFGIWLYVPLFRRDARALLREWQPPLALLFGLCIYIYAPIASSQDPPLNWFFPDTFSGFRSMASASLYRSYVFGLPPDRLIDRIIKSFDIWLTQFTALGALLGIAGGLFLWDKLRGFVVAAGVTFFGTFIYAITYNSFDSYVLLIPAFIVFGLLAAAGLLNLTVSLAGLAAGAKRSWLVSNAGRVAPAVLAAAVIGIPVWSLAFNYSGIDISDDTEARDYVESAFATAEPGSIIIAQNIQAFALWYQSLAVEPDKNIAIVAGFLMDFDWYWEHIQREFPDRVPQGVEGGGVLRLKALVASNIGSVPVFLTQEDASYASLFELTADGPLWRVTG